ncbi:hypothetical protein V6N11_006754 [Hibiscus sabdariffa]|uniref:Uncharacterized protein n=1 Tax=Hibiscus sabdariffa TaxID=183260 RepID=A0ABR2RRW8_9ROSI
MDSDGARADDANVADQGEVQDHAGEMTATEQQESGSNVNQPQVDHAEQNIGGSLAGGELEPGQMALDDSMTGGGCYEMTLEEEDNQISTDAAQTTKMASGNYNMDSGGELQPDMEDDVAFSSQQDEVVQLFKVLIKSPSLGVAPSTQEHHGPYGFFGIVVQASSLDVFRDWNPMPSLNSILSHDIHGRLAHLLKLFSDRPLRFVVTGEALRLHICFKSMPLFCDFRVRY